MKICRGCGETKPLTEYSAEKRVRDGRKSRCRPCLAQQAHGLEAYFREHYRKNREARLAWMRENYSRAAWQRRRRADARARLDDAMGMSLYHSLLSRKGGRYWESILGYDLDALVGHLSAKFQPGMSLENYGAWHIDHVRPRASFAYSSEHDPDFRACWALSNLQPLWAVDNMRKGAKVS